VTNSSRPSCSRHPEDGDGMGACSIRATSSLKSERMVGAAAGSDRKSHELIRTPKYADVPWDSENRRTLSADRGPNRRGNHRRA